MNIGTFSVSDAVLVGYDVFKKNGEEAVLDGPQTFVAPEGVLCTPAAVEDQPDLDAAGYTYGVWVQSDVVAPSINIEVHGDPDLDPSVAKEIVGTFEIAFVADEAVSFGFGAVKTKPKTV